MASVVKVPWLTTRLNSHLDFRQRPEQHLVQLVPRSLEECCYQTRMSLRLLDLIAAQHSTSRSMHWLTGRYPKAQFPREATVLASRWPDGASYEGEYRCGLKHGIGRFQWASGAVYEGDFVEDRLEGSGYFRWPCGSSYEGAWRDGRMHGVGLFRWADGRSYEGEYKHDFKDGQGIFRWPDGRRYDGQWRDGVQHGTGTFTSAHGRCKTTEWRDGQLIRNRRRS